MPDLRGVREVTGYKDAPLLIDKKDIVRIGDWILGQHPSLSLAPLTIRMKSTISSAFKKGVQSPKAFICFTSNWMNPMFGYSHTHMYIYESGIERICQGPGTFIASFYLALMTDLP